MSWCWCANDPPAHLLSTTISYPVTFLPSAHTYTHPLAGGGVDWRHYQLYPPCVMAALTLTLADERWLTSFQSSLRIINSSHMSVVLCFALTCFVPCVGFSRPVSVCIVTIFELCVLPLQPLTSTSPGKTGGEIWSSLLPPSLLGVLFCLFFVGADHVYSSIFLLIFFSCFCSLSCFAP
jgi:hypothetical protein